MSQAAGSRGSGVSAAEPSKPRVVRVVGPEDRAMQVLDDRVGDSGMESLEDLLQAARMGLELPIAAMADACTSCSPAFIEFAAPRDPLPRRAPHGVEKMQQARAEHSQEAGDSDGPSVAGAGQLQDDEGGGLAEPAVTDATPPVNDAAGKDYAAMRARWAGLSTSKSSSAGRAKKRPRGCEAGEAWLS